MPHLEKRRQLYYAILTVPSEAREALGRLRFRKSTGTGDKRQAQIVANQYVAGWKILIEKAKGSQDSVISRAIQWREELEKTVDDEKRDVLESLLLDDTHVLADKAGFAKAKEFYDLSSGIKTLSSVSYEQWKAQLKLEPKTIDQMIKDVDLLIEHFPIIQ